MDRLEARRRGFLQSLAFSRSLDTPFLLRRYQRPPADAVIQSVLHREGHQFAVMFSRQSGKDEMLAQTVAQLLLLHQEQGGSIVLAAPTFRPQAALMRDRLLDRLRRRGARHPVELKQGYVVQCGAASARFLSASPHANQRGQTASLLLVANEAQDIDPAVWDTVFTPMGASTNATTLFLGTAWRRDTLLARQMAHCAQLERVDGFQRRWKVGWEDVAKVLPAYGDHVRRQIEQFGRDHPAIRTEYFLDELDDAGSLFPAQRLAHLRGDHPRRHAAEPGKRYALLIDVAGEDEQPVEAGAFDPGARRDSTAITVVEIGTGQTPAGPEVDGWTGSELELRSRLPVYRVVDRMALTGARTVAVHAQVVDLAMHVWKASAVVVDATGVGAGLASFLQASLGQGRGAIRVLPFVFSAASKSALGWDFTNLIDTGRFKEYVDDSLVGTPEARVTAEYWRQLRAVTFSPSLGPGKLMQWSVPPGR
ncbi:MAG: hypothetical protein KC438_13240, partial [Thermomicrobiales bacterium]|nr:hypothetical protein [Thermomicrobiales bacterium]